MDGTTVIQKAADLVSQYEHFFSAVKERAASFSGNASSVKRSIKADFEALYVMLEHRKDALLAVVQDKMTTSRENDIFELEARQRHIRSTLQQLQQLAVQGLLTEDDKHYQQLLTELNGAKQKLKETSDKFQIKFEGCLKPLASKIANYGEVVSGCGMADEEQSVPTTTKYSSRVFTSLLHQFEASCQLQATRQDLSSDIIQSPLSSWFEYSKELQWRRSSTAYTSSLSQAATVPDYSSIVKKMKDNFTSCTPSPTPIKKVTSESYERWLIPRTNQQPEILVNSDWLLPSEKAALNDTASDAVYKTFHSIASSDSSLWLRLYSSSDERECYNHCISDTSPWLLQSVSTEEEKSSLVVIPPEQDYNDWLFTADSDRPVKEEERSYQAWLTSAGFSEGHLVKEDDWVHQQDDWRDCNTQWLLPSTGGDSTTCNEALSFLSPSGGDSGDTVSDMFGSTQTLTSLSSSDFEVVDDNDL